jgi:hypothetical protein
MEQEKSKFKIGIHPVDIPVSFPDRWKSPIRSIELSIVSFLDSRIIFIIDGIVLLLKDVHEHEYRLYCPFLLDALKNCEHLHMLKCRLSQPKLIYLPKKVHFITCSALFILVPHVKYLPATTVHVSQLFSNPHAVIEIPVTKCD